jgi:hypothetical protein
LAGKSSKLPSLAIISQVAKSASALAWAFLAVFEIVLLGMWPGFVWSGSIAMI